MITIKLSEAKALFDECEAFTEGEMVAEDSPLRLKAEELFGQSYTSHMMYVTTLVYRTLAQLHMLRF